MLKPGDVLAGRYRIGSLLGQGGMADVYAAEHVHLPFRYAIKVIKLQHSRDPSFIQRFQREATILAALKHPHMVEVHDYAFTEEGQPYLVMERLEGQDLAQRQASARPLSVPQAVQGVVQAALALQAAHDAQVVHRDLKPSNLFLCQPVGLADSMDSAVPADTIHVKVLDFGIAKVLQEDPGRPDATASAVLLGTPAYMSPEQIADSRRVDARSDQFALAVIAWELFSGRRAFGQQPGESHFAVLKRVLETELPPVFSLPSAAGPAGPRPNPSDRFEHEQMQRIEQALQRALSKQPERRFPSVADFAAALQTASALAPATLLASARPAQAASQISGDVLGQTQHKTQAGPGQPGPRRRQLGLAMGLSALVLIVGATLGRSLSTPRIHRGALPASGRSQPAEPAPTRLAAVPQVVSPAPSPPPALLPPGGEASQLAPAPATPHVPRPAEPSPRTAPPTRATPSVQTLPGGRVRFVGGSQAERMSIERCLLRRVELLQAERESAEQAIYGRWLFFSRQASLHLGMQADRPGRPPITSAMRVGINSCLAINHAAATSPTLGQPEIAACLPGGAVRCPREPVR